MIEHSRYQIDHLPRKYRLCPLCNSNQVIDDIHFLFQCNKVQRQAFINKINKIIPNVEKKSFPESIKLIINSKDHHLIKLVMKIQKYVAKCVSLYLHKPSVWFSTRAFASNTTSVLLSVLTSNSASLSAIMLTYALACLLARVFLSVLPRR